MDAASVVSQGPGEVRDGQRVNGVHQGLVDLSDQVPTEGPKHRSQPDAAPAGWSVAFPQFDVDAPYVGVDTAGLGDAGDQAPIGEFVQHQRHGVEVNGRLFGQGPDSDVDQEAALDVTGPDDRVQYSSQGGGEVVVP